MTHRAWRIGRIAAATDFSQAGGHAVERAAALAKALATELLLVHVTPSLTFESFSTDLLAALGGPGYSPESLCEEALDRLKRTAADVGARHGIPCDARVASGRPANCIAAMVDGEADLLVVGAHGDRSIHQWLLGSTTQKLLRLSPCPVLVVKRAPRFDYRRVLAPTDFSAASRLALQAVDALLPAAEVHVVHAFEHPYEGMMRHASVDEAVIKRYTVKEKKRLREELHRWVGETGLRTPTPYLHVEHGHPSTRIETWVKELAVQLVAMPAHGKSELEKSFLGSVSLDTVLTAPCDILLLTGRGVN
jgi:nucleotide-binding universal stress UspA family protein